MALKLKNVPNLDFNKLFSVGESPDDVLLKFCSLLIYSFVCRERCFENHQFKSLITRRYFIIFQSLNQLTDFNNL